MTLTVRYLVLFISLPPYHWVDIKIVLYQVTTCTADAHVFMTLDLRSLFSPCCNCFTTNRWTKFARLNRFVGQHVQLLLN